MENVCVISPSEIRRDNSSYVDPQGYVFHYQGEIYRSIQGEAVKLFSDLLASGTVEHLSKNFALVATEKSHLQLSNASDGLVVKHETVWPLSYCVDWCPSQLQASAIATLELAREIVAKKLMLQDAYPWNVLFRGSEPVFVDLTSLIAQEKAGIWPAREQFDAFFLRPLILSSQGKGKAVRALLQDNIAGIGLEEFYRLTSTFYKLGHPGLAAIRWLDRKIQSSTKLKERARAVSESSTADVPESVRRKYFSSLLNKVKGFSFERAGDPWTEYYGAIDEKFDKQAKLTAVREVLAKIRPPRVLDLGCNTGVFSIEAARAGAAVVSVDSSEECAECVFQVAQKEKLTITPFVTDIVAPTPPFGFMGEQYAGIWARVRSHTVLCLGLMHHLHINGRQSFERIAQLLNSVCESNLIFEFVGMDDANIPHLSTRRPINYTLESVRDALNPYFPRIEVKASDRDSRRLLICAK